MPLDTSDFDQYYKDLIECHDNITQEIESLLQDAISNGSESAEASEAYNKLKDLSKKLEAARGSLDRLEDRFSSFDGDC